MAMIASNHHALYINSLVKGVGGRSDEASKNVPTAIAAAKTRNKTAVSRVENKTEAILFSICRSFAQIYRIAPIKSIKISIVNTANKISLAEQKRFLIGIGFYGTGIKNV